LAGFNEHCDEPSTSTKGGEFIDYQEEFIRFVKKYVLSGII
jgi:hypothetical protein